MNTGDEEHSGLRLQNPIPYVRQSAPSVYELPHLSKEIASHKEHHISSELGYGDAIIDYAISSQSVVIELPIMLMLKDPRGVTKEIIAEKWKAFYAILHRVFTRHMQGITTVPYLVSNPYYFLSSFHLNCPSSSREFKTWMRNSRFSNISMIFL
ncbi:hypothetical protein [Sulfobacillus thermosulfidooxidans]|uniref:hypothetical protein n=1 Tax=Sulfobacillus thermosulfidooxidans TaxID=28034 RepID=UPI00096BBD38|nr:hypothetical protein [Sulfobacillus thermosulfidooxidans]OLZ10500.1 hypothetical protein BFX05_01280 [Sulfobacillus thermosulfidooxidans]OLZ14244.1 hypothetical protein BFX06_08140 [Sulfobacillus thermosulfidooxidans]OLZ18987.1 hypothetical protein BFX07_04535 [Sulfobacillus thermosulfidooxidans]